MSEDVSPDAWIKLRGDPMYEEFQVLKRNILVGGAACAGAGSVLTIFIPKVLKLLGVG